MALKIKMIIENGNPRVPPEVMDLLPDYKEHEKICDCCQKAYASGKGGEFCPIGSAFMEALARNPNCEFVK